MYKYQCVHCGAFLDPGERCDCREQESKEREVAGRLLIEERETGQLRFSLHSERIRPWGTNQV